MPESTESKNVQLDVMQSIIKMLEEWYDTKRKALERLHGLELFEVSEALRHLDAVMEDLRNLVKRNVHNFNIRIIEAYRSDAGTVYEVYLIGNAVEFRVTVKPDTPLDKVLDKILADPEQVREVLARAFNALGGVLYKLSAMIDEIRDVAEVKKRIIELERILEELKQYCIERKDEG